MTRAMQTLVSSLIDYAGLFPPAKLDMPRAALRLCCTASQLLKLVKDHPAAFEDLNRRRAARKLHPLH